MLNAITMNTKLKAAIKHTAPYAVGGTFLAAAVASPITWGMLAYSLLRIGKSAYASAPSSAKIPAEQDDLFI